MTGAPETHMTVDEFLTWAEEQPGRYELAHGRIYAMSPERSGHAEAKFAIQLALAEAIKRARLPCYMLPDGMTVRISEDTAYEPDALVYCGRKLPSDTVEVPEPVIIVEVLSPSTRRIDAAAKLTGYFSLPSLQHYLILDPGKSPLIHHQRQSDGTILTRLIGEGELHLEPPGLHVETVSLFA